MQADKIKYTRGTNYKQRVHENPVALSPGSPSWPNLFSLALKKLDLHQKIAWKLKSKIFLAYVVLDKLRYLHRFVCFVVHSVDMPAMLAHPPVWA